MTDFTTAERAMLDRATVPATRSGFAADIVSKAMAGGAWRAPRRDARRGWRRHGRVLIGAGALVLVSAAAAATGLLEKFPIAIPGITRAVAAAPLVEKPKRVARAEKPRAAPARPAATPAPPPLAEPTPLTWRERRDARIAAGLPVRPLGAKRRMALARLNELPPEQRKLVVARFLENHPKVAARLAERGIDPATDQGVRRLQRIERRRAWRQWRMQREGIVPPVR
jgi:hypothetical protein